MSSSAASHPSSVAELSVVLVAGSGLAGHRAHDAPSPRADRAAAHGGAHRGRVLGRASISRRSAAASSPRAASSRSARSRSAAPPRRAGILAATSPVVGLIEDHSYPGPEWAEALLRAHAGPWTGVGPAVDNANPESAASWVNYILGVRRLRAAGRGRRARPPSLAQLGVQARRARAVRRSARSAARVGGRAPGRAPRARPHAVPRARRADRITATCRGCGPRWA